MKLKLILPAFAALAMLQLAPQAAWSWGPYGGYGVSPREARHIWRAEHCAYGRPYGYGYGAPGPCYYHGGLLTGLGRAIF